MRDLQCRKGADRENRIDSRQQKKKKDISAGRLSLSLVSCLLHNSRNCEQTRNHQPSYPRSIPLVTQEKDPTDLRRADKQTGWIQVISWRKDLRRPITNRSSHDIQQLMMQQTRMERFQ